MPSFPTPEGLPVYVAWMRLDEHFRRFMRRVLRPLSRRDLLDE